MLTSINLNKSFSSKLTLSLISNWGNTSTSQQKSPAIVHKKPQINPSQPQQLQQKQLNEIIAVVDKLSKLANELSTTNIVSIPSPTQTFTSVKSANYDINKLNTTSQLPSKLNSVCSKTDNINSKVFFSFCLLKILYF